METLLQYGAVAAIIAGASWQLGTRLAPVLRVLAGGVRRGSSRGAGCAGCDGCGPEAGCAADPIATASQAASAPAARPIRFVPHQTRS